MAHCHAEGTQDTSQCGITLHLSVGIMMTIGNKCLFAVGFLECKIHPNLAVFPIRKLENEKEAERLVRKHSEVTSPNDLQCKATQCHHMTLHYKSHSKVLGSAQWKAKVSVHSNHIVVLRNVCKCITISYKVTPIVAGTTTQVVFSILPGVHVSEDWLFTALAHICFKLQIIVSQFQQSSPSTI